MVQTAGSKRIMLIILDIILFGIIVILYNYWCLQSIKGKKNSIQEKDEYHHSYITQALASKIFGTPDEYVINSYDKQWAFHGWLLFRAPLYPSAIFLIGQPYISVRLYLTTNMEYRIYKGMHSNINEYLVEESIGTQNPSEVFKELFIQHHIQLDENMAHTWMGLVKKWPPLQRTPNLVRIRPNK